MKNKSCNLLHIQSCSLTVIMNVRICMGERVIV